jgi:hypothetical protein
VCPNVLALGANRKFIYIFDLHNCDNATCGSTHTLGDKVYALRRCFFEQRSYLGINIDYFFGKCKVFLRIL